MTLPAAGTSLLLVDPYVTARSISTPLGLLAIAGVLDIISDFRQSSRIKCARSADCRQPSDCRGDAPADGFVCGLLRGPAGLRFSFESAAAERSCSQGWVVCVVTRAL